MLLLVKSNELLLLAIQQLHGRTISSQVIVASYGVTTASDSE